MIEIKNLSKRYVGNDHDTLHEINLTFNDTGLYYLVGKSGAGKSTLLNIIGCMDEEYTGRVLIHGNNIRDLSEKEKATLRFEHIAFAFQSYRAQEEESVTSNLLKALDITTLSKEEKKERIQHRLKQVGLLEKEKALFKNLSGGEKKRISLVRALLSDADILLCDEPLSSLNKNLRRKITSILEEESKRRCVVIITHEKEDIHSLASVYEMHEGKVSLLQKGEIGSNTLELGYERKKYQGIPLIKNLFSTLIAKRSFLIITLIALMISLFSISFSFQLSTTISASLIDNLTKYMEDDCMVVECEDDDGLKRAELERLDYGALNYVAREFDEVIAPSTFYLDSFSSFLPQEEIKLSFQNSEMKIRKLNLDSFLHYSMVEEVDAPIYGEIVDSLDSVILGLDEDALTGLHLLLYGYAPSFIDESTLLRIQDGLSNHLSLQITSQNANWGYQQEHSLSIQGVAYTPTCKIIHPSSIFSNYFVSDIMHFKECEYDEDPKIEEPWTLHKIDGLRLYPNSNATFLFHFLQEEQMEDYTMKVLDSEPTFSHDDSSTHNHILIMKDPKNKVSLSAIASFCRDHQKSVQSLSYSSSVYTYTANGYISGFAKPFFFSKYKERLNEIIDGAYKTKENLGLFQGSLIPNVPSVIKADLASSIDNGHYLKFVTLDEKREKPKYGTLPDSFSQICISKGMAVELYGSVSMALNNDLNTLTLDEIQEAEDGYINHFSSGSVKICGIFDEEEYCIYQNSLFPLCYCFLHTKLDFSDIGIKQAIIKVNLSQHDTDFYLNNIRKYGDFKGSFPMLNMVTEIKNTLSNLSLLFLLFALISLLISVGLWILSLTLIIERERKNIAILLTLGYEKKEISYFYLCFSLFLGMIAFAFSLLLSLFAEKTLQDTLMDMMGQYHFSLLPFLISLSCVLILSFSIGFSLRLKLRDIRPKEAFEKDFL